MANTNRAVAFIDLSILEENYKTIKAKVLPETGILCVVKADAYGHGAVEVCGASSPLAYPILVSPR
jgi:alanine racemase